LWLAAALEGLASSILQLISTTRSNSNQLQINERTIEEVLGKEIRTRDIPLQLESSAEPLSIEARCVLLAEEKACEALVIYSKSVVYCALQVECTLRVARMFETSQPDRDDRVQKVNLQL
jgi:hypothetical protein